MKVLPAILAIALGLLVPAVATAQQDLRNPDQAAPSPAVTQDLRNPDRVAPTSGVRQDLRNADQIAPAAVTPLEPESTVLQADATEIAADGGLGTLWIVLIAAACAAALCGLALATMRFAHAHAHGHHPAT